MIKGKKLPLGNSAESLPDNRPSPFTNLYFCQAHPSHRKVFIKLPLVASLKTAIMETWTLPSKGHSLDRVQMSRCPWCKYFITLFFLFLPFFMPATKKLPGKNDQMRCSLTFCTVIHSTNIYWVLIRCQPQCEVMGIPWAQQSQALPSSLGYRPMNTQLNSMYNLWYSRRKHRLLWKNKGG